MLRLKEKPIEWIKFTAVMAVMINFIVWMIWWNLLIHPAIPVATAGISIFIVVVSALRPFWFRGFYRKGMTVSFLFGQTIGKVLLLMIFFLVVTPMAILLRLLGKDLLQIKPAKEASTYWHSAKSSREFDRMF